MTTIIGILNVTSDSFSDGGEYFFPDRAIAHAIDLVAAGAMVIDIGGESTRPNATPGAPEQEWKRLEPVLAAICPLLEETGVSISVDTRHVSTAAQAIPYGIHWINDVSGGDDPDMLALIAQHPALRYVIMHHLGIPVNPDVTLPAGCDVIAEISSWATRRLASLARLGVSADRVILDPGIGYGKTALQSIEILQRIDGLCAIGCELLVGHSRKSFMQRVTDRPAKERDIETVIGSVFLAARGVHYLRVHDVDASKRGIAMAKLLGMMKAG